VEDRLEQRANMTFGLVTVYSLYSFLTIICQTCSKTHALFVNIM